MSGPTPRGRLDRRKLQNKPIRINPARMVLNLILEDVMVKIEDSVRLSEMRKAKALAIESLKRDAAIFRFRQTGMITVTNAVSGNMYRLFLDNPGIHVFYERTIRQLYDSLDQQWIWNRMCQRYHNATGDPCSKSDTFLSVMSIIRLRNSDG